MKADLPPFVVSTYKQAGRDEGRPGRRTAERVGEGSDGCAEWARALCNGRRASGAAGRRFESLSGVPAFPRHMPHLTGLMSGA